MSVTSPSSLSKHGDAFTLEHGRELHQRQPDESARIVGHDTLDQRDSESFDLGAAGAVVRMLELQVALDLVIGVTAKAHRRWNDGDLERTGRRIEQGKRRVKYHVATAHRLELFHGAIVVSRLTEARAVERSNLVAADHQAGGCGRAYVARLYLREAQSCLGSAFSGEDGFIHRRRPDLEGQPQAFQ